MKRSSSDMYNEVCKDCKNYWRKMTYYRRLEKLQRPIPIPPFEIFPLNDHNRHVLKSIPLTGNHSLRISFVSLGKTSTASISLSPTSFSFTYLSPDLHACPQTFRFSAPPKLHLETMLLPVLKDLRIRLG
jgi:hypothetical protein